MTGREIVAECKALNPGKRFAVYAEDRAVGYWHEGVARWIPLFGRAFDSGRWLELPPGELYIDGKPVFDQALWKEVL